MFYNKTCCLWRLEFRTRFVLVCSINVFSHILHKAIVGQEVTQVNNYYLVVPARMVSFEGNRERMIGHLELVN